MKIIKANTGTFKFAELSEGEVFTYALNYYLKIWHSSDGGYNAVNLNSNEIVYIPQSTDVVKVNAKLVLS